MIIDFFSQKLSFVEQLRCGFYFLQKTEDEFCWKDQSFLWHLYNFFFLVVTVNFLVGGGSANTSTWIIGKLFTKATLIAIEIGIYNIKALRSSNHEILKRALLLKLAMSWGNSYKL